MKKFFKMVIVVLIGITVFYLHTSGVYAKVNSDYFSITLDTSTSTDTSFVGDIASEVMKYITKFVLTVAKLVENVVKNFAAKLFGVNVFPWEDLIVFNSLPYLDINFFNPSDGSIFTTAAGDIVKTVYFSLLTLSLSIVGIGVTVTAIKLAISSIAAEKAKYKEAITKCLYTVILLFSVHVLLSFVFYLNEEICEGASKLLENLLTQQEVDALANEVENASESAGDYVYYNTLGVNKSILDGTSGLTWLWTNGAAGWDALYGQVLTDTYDNNAVNAYNEFYNLVNGDSKLLNVANYLISKSTYYNNRFSDITYIRVEDGEPIAEVDFWDTSYLNNCIKSVSRLNIDLWNIKYSDNLETFKSRYGSSDQETEWFTFLANVYTTYYLGQYDSDISNIISTLGNTFKEDANDIYLTSNSNDNAYIATYLYAILIVQSLMLLISYLKRIFYVTLLAVLAPVVVVYDFFMGDSNKVFNTWIKELCSLVFVQAMQAMLLAIMLAIVVKLYTDAGDGDEAAKQSVGLYAIFIMVIIPKVELLVKKIFGLGSGVADVSMTGGKESLLKTGMALRLGGRVLNNAGKFVGGAVGVGSGLFGAGRKQSNIAKNNYEAAKLNAGGGSTAGGALGSSSGSRRATSNRIGSSRSSLSGNSAAASGDQALTVGNLAQAIKSANAKSPEELEQEMKDAKHKRWQQVRQGAQQMASGALETAGAVGGASLGAVLSMGTGGDDLVSNMIAGAGIGDVVGETATNLTAGTVNKMVDWNYDRKKLKNQVKKSEDKLNKARSADAAYRAAVTSARGAAGSGNVAHSAGASTARRVTNNTRGTVNSAGATNTTSSHSNGTNSTKRTIKAPKISETQKAANEVVKQMDNLHDQYAVKAAVSKIKGDKEGHDMYKNAMNNIDRDINKFKKQSQEENQVKYKAVKRPNNPGGTRQATQSNTSSRSEEETMLNLGRAMHNYEIAKRKNQPNTRRSVNDASKNTKNDSNNTNS